MTIEELLRQQPQLGQGGASQYLSMPQQQYGASQYLGGLLGPELVIVLTHISLDHGLMTNKMTYKACFSS